MPTVGYDYCFMRNTAGGDYVPVLVSKDKKTKLITAHVVPCKGADVEWITKQCNRDIQKCGHYGPVTLRSDQEPAIIDLLKAVAVERSPAESILEHSAVGDSQGNGFVERAVRSVEEITRVLKIDLEKRMGEQLPVDTIVFSWLIEHATDCWNKLNVGADGKTSFERCKGKRYNGEMLPFGSPVMYRVAGKVQGGVMTERWYEGLWLGQRFHTQEHLVGKLSDGEVVRTRCVKELPNPITLALLRTIVGQPWAPAGTAKPERDVKPPVLPSSEPPPHFFQPRHFRITQDILERFGYTPGCRKCRMMQQGDSSQPTLGHKVECRARLKEELNKDEGLKGRVDAMEERRNKYLANELEKNAETASREHFKEKENTASSSSSAPGARDPEEAECQSEIPIPVALPKRGTGGSDDEPNFKSLRRNSEPEDRIFPPPPEGPDEREDGKRTEHPKDESDEPPSRRRRACYLVASIHGDPEDSGREEVQEEDSRGCENSWETLEPEVQLKVWDPKALKQAKKEELDRFRRMKVYEVVDRSVLTNQYKPLVVGVRWVISEEQTGLKARLVAQEFATKNIDKDCLFAGTPGLPIIRSLISRVASGQAKDYKLLVADIKTAFL